MTKVAYIPVTDPQKSLEDHVGIPLRKVNSGEHGTTTSKKVPADCFSNSDICSLTASLKHPNAQKRKQAALRLGSIPKISVLKPLCNIALFDRDEGVRKITATAILDVARSSPKMMRTTIKIASHPLLTSLQKYPTPTYCRCVGWVLSNLEFSERELKLIIDTLQKKCDVLINLSCKNVLSEVIRTLKGQKNVL